MSDAVENVVQISGRLTIDTVAVHFKEGLPLPEDKVNMIVDLAKVEAVDSAAVSLMLSWLRVAQVKKVQLSFVNVPGSLHSLANLYGVAETLSLTSAS